MVEVSDVCLLYNGTPNCTLYCSLYYTLYCTLYYTTYSTVLYTILYNRLCTALYSYILYSPNTHQLNSFSKQHSVLHSIHYNNVLVAIL